MTPRQRRSHCIIIFCLMKHDTVRMLESTSATHCAFSQADICSTLNAKRQDTVHTPLGNAGSVLASVLHNRRSSNMYTAMFSLKVWGKHSSMSGKIYAECFLSCELRTELKDLRSRVQTHVTQLDLTVNCLRTSIRNTVLSWALVL